MSEYITINTIKINQNEHNIFLFKVKASELLEIAIFNSREIDRETGIQRTLNVSRSKEIADYIDEDYSVIANNIIINIKSENFIEDKNVIKIKKERNSIFIIDGQHRLRAFNYTEKKDFELPVSAFVDLSWAEIAEIFVKINYYQKPVNKSLVYDLLGISPDLFPDFKEAHTIVQVLNDSISSPWFGMIKMLGIGKGIITQATFINALSKYKILNDILKSYTVSEKALILANYFDSIKNIFPDKWGNKNSLLSRSIGFNAFMLLFPEIFNDITSKHKSFEKSIVTNYLKPINTIDFDDPSIKGLGGMSGVKRFAQIIKEKLVTI